MASLYKERSKCLVKLPTMQYNVTDVGKEDGERRVGKSRAGGGVEGGTEKQGDSMKERGELQGGVVTDRIA